MLIFIPLSEFEESFKRSLNTDMLIKSVNVDNVYNFTLLNTGLTRENNALDKIEIEARKTDNGVEIGSYLAYKEDGSSYIVGYEDELKVFIGDMIDTNLNIKKPL